MPETKKILIIEDDPKSIKLQRDLLEAARYEVIVSNDAESGISIAKDEVPDLITMDYQLPGMNGEFAVMILRSDEKTKHIPVVFVTASSMREDKERFALLHVKIITKPVNTRTFVKELEEVLNGKREKD